VFGLTNKDGTKGFVRKVSSAERFIKKYIFSRV